MVFFQFLIGSNQGNIGIQTALRGVQRLQIPVEVLQSPSEPFQVEVRLRGQWKQPGFRRVRLDKGGNILVDLVVLPELDQRESEFVASFGIVGFQLDVRRIVAQGLFMVFFESSVGLSQEPVCRPVGGVDLDGGPGFTHSLAKVEKRLQTSSRVS